MKLGPTPTREDAEAFAEFSANEARSKARAELIANLGFVDDDSLPGNLKAAAQQIKDGKQYRDDLLGQLHANTIKLEGNDEAGIKAAERIKTVYASADLEMIKAENARLEARLTALIPNGPVSKTGGEEKRETFVDVGNYG